MTARFRCPKCGNWFTPDEHDDPETNLCRYCETGAEEDPETEQDRIDAAGDDLFHSMREDGEL